ncbi:MAG TPA: flippase activity-associated protein Agl23 [Acidobacteriota bacterium]|nr:flippase activity-associated protein Agl23 [Acidobacteriota bacterium]
MTKKAFRGLFLVAFAGALLFRFVRLDVRPMHNDEANQAAKFGELLEKGDYVFDPQDHHGPTLYYLTLPAAWAAGTRTFAGLDEFTLRAVPALFGAGLLLLLLLYGGSISREAALAAAVLAAISPALTYYSRFYIQETLLVFFLAGLVGTGWRYARTRKAGWALAAGVSAGLLLATKETSLLLLAGLAAAFVLVAGLETVPVRHGRVVSDGSSWVWRDQRVKLPAAFHIALFVIAAAAVAALFYSSFFRNPEGLAAAFKAVGASITRGTHPGVHAHPWDYYLRILAYPGASAGPIRSEAFLLFLAVAGGIAAFSRETAGDASSRFARFLLFFTVITGTVYSLIPYKTPWNVLPLYFGLVLLAGNGVALLLKISRLRLVKIIILALLAPGFVNLAVQAYRADFVDHSNPANPYAYAPTSPDLLRLVAAVDRAAAVSPNGQNLLVEVVARPDETWPLPWYFRKLGRVGYWTSVEAAAKDVPLGRAEVVITSASFADQVAALLGDAYDQNFFGLRPEVPLCLFTKRGP